MTLYGFGFNEFGQLKANAGHIIREPVQLNVCDNISVERYIRVSILWNKIIAVTDDSKVLMWCSRNNELQRHSEDGNCTILKDRSTNVCFTRDYVIRFDSKFKYLFMCNSSFENSKTIVVDASDTEEIEPMNMKATEDGKTLLFITSSGSLFKSTTPIQEVYNTECITIEPLQLIPCRPNPIKVKQVSCGKQHTMIVSKIGIVFTFGIGNQGQLGLGSIESRTEPTIVEALEGLYVSQVSAGGWHSMALTDSGNIYIWGWNNYGQLGFPSGHCGDVGEVINIQTYPECLEIPKLCLQESTDTDHTQKNKSSQSEVDSMKFDMIACGSRHSLALNSEGEILSWGWNKYGQLGYKSAEINDKPRRIDTSNIRNVVGLYAGHWNSIFETTN